MTSALPLYANLRLLRKSLEYVVSRDFANRHLLWTAWHLEIATQVDLALRRDIATVGRELKETTRRAHLALADVRYEAHARGRSVRLRYESDKGGTVFGIFRSAFWDSARQVLDLQYAQAEPQAADKARILTHFLTDYRRMDFLILMSLLPGAPRARRPAAGDRGRVATTCRQPRHPSCSTSSAGCCRITEGATTDVRGGLHLPLPPRARPDAVASLQCGHGRIRLVGLAKRRPSAKPGRSSELRPHAPLTGRLP